MCFVGFARAVFSTLLKRVSGDLPLIRRRVRVKHAMHGRPRDAMGLGDLPQAQAVLTISMDRVASGLED
jgi:hypothetical protein